MNINKILIRLNKNNEISKIITLINKFGFRAHNVKSWNALKMRAVIAILNNEIIGIIPYDQRILNYENIKYNLAHQTAVGIKKEFRNQGLGNLMQLKFISLMDRHIDYISVYREDKTSKAYSWYIKNKFYPIVNIESYILIKPNISIIKNQDINFKFISFNNNKVEVDLGFLDQNRKKNTIILKDNEFKNKLKWINNHPYQKYYKLKLIEFKFKGKFKGYCVIAVGKLHSNSKRVEIFDIDFLLDSNDIFRHLILFISEYCKKYKYSPFRVSLAYNDIKIQTLKKFGFINNWKFDYLIKNCNNKIKISTNKKIVNYSSIYFI